MKKREHSRELILENGSLVEFMADLALFATTIGMSKSAKIELCANPREFRKRAPDQKPRLRLFYTDAVLDGVMDNYEALYLEDVVERYRPLAISNFFGHETEVLFHNINVGDLLSNVSAREILDARNRARLDFRLLERRCRDKA